MNLQAASFEYAETRKSYTEQMICEILMALEQNAVSMGMEYADCQNAMGGALSNDVKKNGNYHLQETTQVTVRQAFTCHHNDTSVKQVWQGRHGQFEVDFRGQAIHLVNTYKEVSVTS